MTAKVLVIEDDYPISELVVGGLAELGLEARSVANGTEGLELALSGDFDLVILDIMLPGTNGLDVCRQIRRRKAELPVLMLTARSEEIDKVLGLELGATDYLVKPFSIRELGARVRALLNLVSAVSRESANKLLPTECITRGGFLLDPAKRRVTVDGVSVELTATEFDILHLLSESPGQVFSREQITECLSGDRPGVYATTITNHVNRIRAKIEKDASKPRYLLTVRGVGYSFTDD